MLSMIIAAAENRVMGKDNQMPWHLPNDLQYFKRSTMGKPMIMGRKTYESLGKPLPGRPHIIITRQTTYQAPNANEQVQVVTNLADAIIAAQALVADTEEQEVMVIGGAEICSLAFPQTERLYLTQVHAEVDGDVYFPEFNPDEWREVSREDYQASENNPYDYSFIVFERIK